MHSINGPRGETNLPLASQKSSFIKFAERTHGEHSPAVDAQKWNAMKKEHLDLDLLPIHSVRHDSSS